MDFLGGDHVFLWVVKPPAMYGPHGTADALFQQVRRLGLDEVVV